MLMERCSMYSNTVHCTNKTYDENDLFTLSVFLQQHSSAAQTNKQTRHVFAHHDILYFLRWIKTKSHDNSRVITLHFMIGVLLVRCICSVSLTHKKPHTERDRDRHNRHCLKRIIYWHMCVFWRVRLFLWNVYQVMWRPCHK